MDGTRTDAPRVNARRERCYRCGARMNGGAVCPACGFDLDSPVEFTVDPFMCGALRVVDLDSGETLWQGECHWEAMTFTVDLPVPARLRLIYRDGQVWWMVTARNGEAYRFSPSPRLAKGFVNLIKTRRVPKNK